ncbi:ribonuclease HII [Tenuifilaceae bacterium CYCD]|nr:ribonuclease HII [Tenuifilaceae bacterium CYCD]
MKTYYKIGVVEAGCDEAGRGCLAGPVFAAAVVLPMNFENPFINDSKQLSVKKRNELRDVIQNNALDYAVASVDNIEIDKINILNASILAMHKAIDGLKRVKPEHLLVDGNKFKLYKRIPHTCIVHGDAIYQSIAAASILAKTYRDEFMVKINKEFPYYKWNENMGYPTKAHREAIAKYGVTPYHRLSYRLINNDTQLKLPIDFKP